jgi:hypothetical protein
MSDWKFDSDLDAAINDLAGLATALAMAIDSNDRLAMEEEDRIHALNSIAAEVMYKAQEARKLWCQRYEKGTPERPDAATVNSAGPPH